MRVVSATTDSFIPTGTEFQNVARGDHRALMQSWIGRRCRFGDYGAHYVCDQKIKFDWPQALPCVLADGWKLHIDDELPPRELTNKSEMKIQAIFAMERLDHSAAWIILHLSLR